MEGITQMTKIAAIKIKMIFKVLLLLLAGAAGVTGIGVCCWATYTGGAIGGGGGAEVERSSTGAAGLRLDTTVADGSVDLIS